MERKVAVVRVALTGHSGVGKTTVAHHLRDQFGFQICNTGALCRQVTRLIYGAEEKADLVRVSDALQTIDPQIFLKASLRAADLSKPTVIDALRFGHDLEFARRHGFLVVRITASLEKRSAWAIAQGLTIDFAELDEHRSESELDGAGVDAEVDNASDVQSLTRAVASLLRLE